MDFLEELENKLGYKLDLNIQCILSGEQSEHLIEMIEECNIKNIDITPKLYKLCKIVYCNILKHESEVCA